MTKEKACKLIKRMHQKLDEIIISHNYNLLSDEVLQYSEKLDKVLVYYTKMFEKEKLKIK